MIPFWNHLCHLLTNEATHAGLLYNTSSTQTCSMGEFFILNIEIQMYISYLCRPTISFFAHFAYLTWCSFQFLHHWHLADYVKKNTLVNKQTTKDSEDRPNNSARSINWIKRHTRFTPTWEAIQVWLKKSASQCSKLEVTKDHLILSLSIPLKALWTITGLRNRGLSSYSIQAIDPDNDDCDIICSALVI